MSTVQTIAKSVARRDANFARWLALSERDDDDLAYRLGQMRNGLNAGESAALRSWAVRQRMIVSEEQSLSARWRATTALGAAKPVSPPTTAAITFPAPAAQPARPSMPVASASAPPPHGAVVRLSIVNSLVRAVWPMYAPWSERMLDIARMHDGRFSRRRTGSWWQFSTLVLDDLIDSAKRVGIPVDGIDGVRAIMAGQASERAQLVVESATLQIRVPASIKLYGHQDAGIRFLMARAHCLLADDQGLGKTIQTILALHNVCPNGKVLIFSPKTLTSNWRAEFMRWLPKSDVAVAVSGSPAPQSRIVITSIDAAKVVGSKLRASLLDERWDCVVVDEAQYVAKPTTKRWKVVSAVSARSARVWLLTGTPMTSRPLDLFGLLRLMRHPLGDDRHAYGRRYCAAQHNGHGWDYRGASNTPELSDRLSSHMLRRTKDEVLDLPPKIRSVVRCNVPDHLARMEPKAIDVLMRLRAQVAIAKIDATWQQVESILDAGEKVIVFSEYIAVLDAISARAEAAKIGSVRVDGSISGAARGAAVERFQTDESTRVFVGQTIAAGVGITLTAATSVVFNDLCLVPAHHAQAEDRAYRIGTTSRVSVTYMVSESLLDDAMWELLAGKIDLIKAFEGGLQDANLAMQSIAVALIAKVNRAA